MSFDSSARLLELLVRKIGQAVSWLTLSMVLLMFGLVALRYWFDTGWIWLQESVTWMHAAVLMLGSAYTLADDQHVRVDIFYRGMGARQQAAVNLTGTLIFLLPFAAVIGWFGWHYALLSWGVHESSQEAGGLPYPWVPLMKSFIPATAMLLGVQGTAMLLRSWQVLLRQPSSGSEA
jgi:TRAP-type mannitol/chloroaromatic compound transport system permease small subunit